MSDHSDIHNIIDRIFTNESELIKEKARNCLDFTTKAITNSFDEQNSIKFIEALSAYFGAKMSFEEATKAKDLNEYSSENSNESSSDSEVDEPKAPVPVVRRKRANASNGFNNFLSIEGKSAIEGSLLWKAKTDAEKEEYRLMITKPTEETKELYMFQPFLKWERLAYRLLHEHQIHIMAICAHECEDGRIVSPMPLCNSEAGITFYQELHKRAGGLVLEERFDRIANEKRSDQQHQKFIDEQSAAKRKAVKLSSQKKKKKKTGNSPRVDARKADNAFVRSKLREIIGNVLPHEMTDNGQVPMAIFDKKGFYIRGSKDYKIKNWPFNEVLPLRSYTSSEIRVLKSYLPKIHLEKLDLPVSSQSGT